MDLGDGYCEPRIGLGMASKSMPSFGFLSRKGGCFDVVFVWFERGASVFPHLEIVRGLGVDVGRFESM